MTNDTSTVLASGNLRQFFADRLSEAADNQSLSVSPHAMNYVTELLVAFQETARLFEQKDVRIPVLADMLAEALEADLYRRISILKHMGDTSLMVSGFFPEALSRRSVDIHYYQRMGEVAYSHVGALSEEVSVFDELSERFVKLSAIINEVSEQTLERDYNVLKLLEFYSNTGAERVLEKLKRQNIVPLHQPPRSPKIILE